MVGNVSLGLRLPPSSPYGSGCLSPVGDGLKPASSVPSFVLCAVLVVSYVRAFCMVAIPQSGLLAQVRSFWLRVGRSCPILKKHFSPRLPCHLLVVDAGICTAFPLGELLLVLIIYLFFLPVMLPSVLPRLATDSAGRVFSGVWKPLFLKFPSRDGLPFPGRSSSPPPLSPFSSFIFFPTCF